MNKRNLVIAGKSVLEITQTNSPSYGPRTYWNAVNSDLTIAMAVDFTTAGERKTKQVAQSKYMCIPLAGPPCDYVGMVVDSLSEIQAKVVNIAGNGIYTLVKHHWLQGDVNIWVCDLLRLVIEQYPITQIISGGQTGVDTAGIVAAYNLGIPAKMVLPLGCKRRDIHGVDREYSENEIYEEILKWDKRLPIWSKS